MLKDGAANTERLRGWVTLLEGIEQRLQETLSQLEQLDLASPAAEATVFSLQPYLDRLPEQQTRANQSIGAAGEAVQEAHLLLDAGVERLQAWIDRVHRLGKQEAPEDQQPDQVTSGTS